MNFSLFLTASHFDTKVSRVKLGESIVWMKQNVVQRVFNSSLKLINSYVDISNLLVTMFHVLRKLLLKWHFITRPFMHKNSIYYSSCRQSFKCLLVNLLWEFSFQKVLQIPPWLNVFQIIIHSLSILECINYKLVLFQLLRPLLLLLMTLFLLLLNDFTFYDYTLNNRRLFPHLGILLLLILDNLLDFLFMMSYFIWYLHHWVCNSLTLHLPLNLN